MLATNELMNSRLSGSEEALARLSIEKIRREQSAILIGGLGMGFTLRAALAAAGPQARIVVAELMPAVIAWAKGPMSDIFAGSLEDPRVTLAQTDVADPINNGRDAWDAILLDVDNGPDGISQSGNDALYSHGGLGRAKAALRPGGVLAVWSSGPDDGFSKRLKQAGFAVEIVNTRARCNRGARHVIWLAQRPA